MATTNDKNNVYYVVKDGDTIYSIAAKYSMSTEELLALNPQITNPDVIHKGDKILVSGTPTSTNSNGKTVTIAGFGCLSTSPRSIFVTWNWTEENTENYRVIWRYRTSDTNYAGENIWFTGSDSTTSNEDTRESIYNAPENADAVKVKIKPMSKSSVVSGSTGTSGSWDWTTELYYYFNDGPPAKPANAPTVSIDKYKLTVELDGLESDAAGVEFQVIKDHNSEVFNTGKAIASTGHVSYSCTIEAGSKYKVRCRTYRAELYSEWTDYSSTVTALPTSPTISKVETISKTEVKLTWTKVNNAKAYSIQYVPKNPDLNLTKEEYFITPGVSPSSVDITADTAESTNTHVSCNLVNLATGANYYVRVSAVNDDSVASDWSGIESFVIGTTPSSPTTWSSTTTAVVGEPLKLYWMHNSEDGSVQTSAKLLLRINDTTELTYTFPPNEYTNNIVSKVYKNDPDDSSDKTYVCEINTNHSLLSDGSKIEWSVSTAGVTGNLDYSEYSIVRTVDIYAPPTISLNLKDKNDILQQELTSFPFYVNATVGNTANQQPTGYYVTVIANDSYTTVDNVGKDKIVSAGSEVYSEYIDTSNSVLSVELSANNINLENNVSYTVKCTVGMNSGLSTTATTSFKVGWAETMYAPNAEIAVDKKTLAAYIRPYSNGSSDALLSVYRREFDGSFTELASDLENGKNIFITDPHPALDYARYRIVAKSKTTGSVGYNDLPGYLIGETAVIIQWNEQWLSFDATEDVLEHPQWAGSMLKLPYNVNVSDNYNPDVSLVKYAGRSRPVSYYGTHLGENSTWDVTIPKSDKETLYAIRRLATWMGDVYVREPSGSGYWANVTVTFSQKYDDLTIPITLNITRVEGGV